jgi:CDP-diacylglycerol--glycerol-3-phosphate 3-phosphatidyltransferase
MITGVPAMLATVRTLPNVLTCLRLVAVPFLGAILALSGGSSGGRLAALVLFAAASLTDVADGWLARRRGQCSDFGAIADPIADKALIATALVCLSGRDVVPWWATGVVLAREVAVTALRMTVLRHGVIPASRGGKVKTVTQTALVVLALVAPTWSGPLLLVVVLTVVWTVLTALDYVAKAAALRRDAVLSLPRRPVGSVLDALDQQGGGAGSTRVRS